MTIPLRHFLVALGFLVAGSVGGVLLALASLPGLGSPAYAHLLLVGWICLTIMGAMTQFVPVWSGVSIHSKRLANAQLVAVTGGLAGFAVALLFEMYSLLAVFGAVMTFGFWLFVYNIASTLTAVDGYDVTERHFLAALAFFVLLTLAGILLALTFTQPLLSDLPITYAGLLGAHVTLAVFGAVLTTIYGAVYQLATMFTQSDLEGIDHHLQSFEEVGHIAGVLLLAVGRLFDITVVAAVGGVLILAAAVAVGFVLARRLYEMQVEWTPMHSRYSVLALALIVWGVVSVPAWITQPTSLTHLFGAAGSVHLLALGVVGFVVLGTLYHVIPFIIWVHQYSDRLGLEPVPMVDDLYDDRLAATDFSLFVSGTVLLVISDLVFQATLVTATGGVLLALGAIVFTVNMVLVVRNHGPRSLDSVLFGSILRRADQSEQATADQH